MMTENNSSVLTASRNEKVKKTALLITTITAFTTPFMSSSINIALPAIGKEFMLNAVLLSWVASSFLLSAAVLLVPFGKLADIYGRKKLFMVGVIIYTAASLFCALSPTVLLLIAFRIIQGIGSALVFGTAVAILSSVYPPGERGRALGINVSVTYLGLSIGPFLGGVLTQNLGWRSLFYVNVPLGIIVIFLVLARLKGEWAEARGEKFDAGGSVILCLALVALMYGFTLLPSINGSILLLFAIAGFLIFIRWESRAESPVLNLRLFSNNTVFMFSNAAALINYSATFAIGFLLSLYLQYIKAFTPQRAGLVLVAQPVVMMLVSPFAGRLSDRVEPGVLASIGMGLLTLGLFVLAFISALTPTGYIILALLVIGIGFGLFTSPNTNAIMSSVEKKLYGVASATLATMRLTGQMLSMAISIMVFSVVIGNIRITPEYYGLFLYSVKMLFAAFSVLCLLGVFASLKRGKLR
ncbi:MAG: MFS transporter [Ignavibacteria bacterium]|jgi:EmrB/QacA subfamily drug resistance transporter|nr:MFS transporter [Ignavibacteria bacterium]MCU7501881.1 MFS transporter [Ignavibacteria bacterium]MCU7514773.1 MFS transporter [Ignavibacteria bacterium]